MTTKEKWINGLSNLGLGVVGLIPGGKAWKVVKSLAIYGPTLVGLGIMGPESLSKIKKANDGTYDLTYDDWKEIAASISMITGLSSNTASGVKMRLLKYKPDGKVKGYTVKDISTKKEYDLTPAEVEHIAQVGETKGQEAAITEIKSILKKNPKYKDRADEINNIDFGIEYGSPLFKERGKFGWWNSKHFLNRKTFQVVVKPVHDGQPNPIAAYYADNPYRRGNPYNQWDESTQNKWFPLASDYALANGIRTSLLGFPTKFKFDFLKSLKNLGKGPGYYSNHIKTAEIEVGDIKVRRNIPKDHELIKVKNGDQEQVVELAPLKDKDNKTVPNEYVNVKNKNEIYTKTADGKFEKKVTEYSSTPTPQDSFTEEQWILDNTAIPTRDKTDFRNKIKHLKPAEVMDKHQLIKRYGHLIPEGTTIHNGGFFSKYGTLYYFKPGGKLHRLNNYLNK